MAIIIQIWLEIWKLKRALSEFYVTSWEWRKLGMHIMNLMFLMNRYWRLQSIKLAVTVFNLFEEINQYVRDNFSPHSSRLGLHLPFVKIHFVLFTMLYLLKNRLSKLLDYQNCEERVKHETRGREKDVRA